MEYKAAHENYGGEVGERPGEAPLWQGWAWGRVEGWGPDGQVFPSQVGANSAHAMSKTEGPRH